MRGTTIVGWAFDGAIYCSDHKPSEAGHMEVAHPIFASDEDWQDDVCDACHWPLDDSREVFGAWSIAERKAYCLRHMPLGVELFPIMKGWNGGDKACAALGCGARIEPNASDDDDTDEQAEA